MATNIGMMDSAYFVGRSEILSWINFTLHLNLYKLAINLWKGENLAGGKDTSKKPSQLLPSVKGAPRVQLNSNARKPSGKMTGHSAKASRPASIANINPDHVEEVTELKLLIDSVEKERDFYFVRLRDIEILCQSPGIGDLLVIKAIQKILYAVDNGTSVVAEAQEMLSLPQKDAVLLSPIIEFPEERTSPESHKRKSVTNLEVGLSGQYNILYQAKDF